MFLRKQIEQQIVKRETVGEPYVVSTVLEADDRHGRTRQFAVTYEARLSRQMSNEPDPYSDRYRQISVPKVFAEVEIIQVLEDGHDVTDILASGIRYQLADAAKRRERQIHDVRNAEAA